MFSIALLLLLAPSLPAQPLAGTKPLEADGDLAAKMVAGIDTYLMRAIDETPKKRAALWKPDFSSPDAYAKWAKAKRESLAKILGVIDKRVADVELEYLSTFMQPSLIAETNNYQVHTVRWPVLPGVDAEGLLLEPQGQAKACVVAIPDADWTPEMLAGLVKGIPKEAQFARILADNGCRVLIPTLIDRQDTWSGNPKVVRMTNQPHREFIYRMSFEMGRHIIGYEIQKVLAAVDWFAKESDHPPIGVYGHGEGGLLALYSAALDERIEAVVVSSFFGKREEMWKEPIYRNVWGLLTEFGDAEVATLLGMVHTVKGKSHVEMRKLIVFDKKGPAIAGPPAPSKGRSGAAPGFLPSAAQEGYRDELAKLLNYTTPLKKAPATANTTPADNSMEYDIVGFLLEALGLPDKMRNPAEIKLPVDKRKNYDPEPRQKRQFDQLVDFTQKLLPEGEARRVEFFNGSDFSSPAEYKASTQAKRDYFWDEIIGKLPAPTKPMNAKTRLVYNEPKWKGYEVTLDQYDEDVFCYGILLVPSDLKPGEKRPVVVCQHGLEGRPQDIVNPKQKTKYYNSFGAQLADRGYIVFAPQNPYIGGNKFRQLQRKANPLKLSIYSFIVRQHERILQWLGALPFADTLRIAYYGLSYGGKVAMRIPALLDGYCLSICSGDFNEWIWKNITLSWRGSYMFTGEYEMYEFDLGNTFNYAEMAALIAPRPFMVERGHDDGVGIDEQVAYEYAKVRYLYAKLKIPEKTSIEFFPGGHEIHGKGTFEFLDRHLNWKPNMDKKPEQAQPKSAASDAEHWDNRYRDGDLPWDTGLPSTELQRAIAESGPVPGRALELGCGTGTNTVWLAQLGFDCTGVDLSPRAIERARQRAQAAGAQVRWAVGDVLTLGQLGPPFDFFFDRGCYHVVRRIDAGRYVAALDRWTAPAAQGLVLTGNARCPRTPGPPVVTQEELRAELGRAFEIVRLREFSFDLSPADKDSFLGWSCWLRKNQAH
jgi:cephalosporin-C deacetylase-like acetyl esterase/SAM-dependent methyltransferase